jgi:high-affinity Fe2+/Pb2+ permease
MARPDAPDRLVGATTLFGKALYFVIAITLLCIAIGVIGYSVWNVRSEIQSEGDPMRAMLNAIGLTVLALAVIDVSKYLFDEEVLRSRELRAAAEARGTLTKFLTIISIAVSLEAVVLIFGAAKESVTVNVLYAGFLLFAVVAMVLVLGLYQFLSAKSEQLTGKGVEANAAPKRKQ